MRFCAFALLGVVIVQATAAAKGPAVPIGSEVADFALRDYRSKEHRLADHAEAKVVVLAVLGAECPLAKLYAPRVQELSDRYADRGVVFLGLNANVQDSITEIAAHARRHELDFPILKDVGQTVIDALGATRTPEVVVLDARRRIRYRGRIDDQYGIGYGKQSPANNYVADAIDALLAGKPVATPAVEPIGCLIGRSSPAADSASDADVTYTGQVASILNRRCVECHRAGEIAPFSLTDYESAAGWSDMIAEVVRQGRMPPWHAAEPVSGRQSHDDVTLVYAEGIRYANERRLPESERDALLRWAAAGAPRGEGESVATVPRYDVADWHLPAEPDLVVAMSEEPFAVPAEGTVKYQYFRVKTGFTEDKWVRASEVVPGNRAVVHHVLVFARQEGENESEAGDGFLSAYVPGLKPAVFPDGMAKRIPAGSDLIFQVHYTPIGSPQTDISRVGLLFAEADEIDFCVESRHAVNRRIRIRPGEADQHFEARDDIPDEHAELLAMMPHMHLRGQAFRYFLERNGKRLALLDVPHYDFNWQTGYELAEPLPLLAGDRIFCEAWFDNSPENLANPDPTAHVRWGDQTWDEMLIGYYDVAVPRDETPRNTTRKAIEAARPAIAGSSRVDDRVRETLDRYDADRDGQLTAGEVPDRHRPLHKRLDRDGDGRVTAGELRRLYERNVE